LPANADINGDWGGSPKGSQGAVAPVFSPFPRGKGGQGDWGYNNPSGAQTTIYRSVLFATLSVKKFFVHFIEKYMQNTLYLSLFFYCNTKTLVKLNKKKVLFLSL